MTCWTACGCCGRREELCELRTQAACRLLADIRDLDARLKTAAAQISDLVAATGTSLTSLFGVGMLIAGRILAETGDVSRFATKDKFASCNGTAPTGVSSGDQVPPPVVRAGNRRINYAVHMMAVTQIRYSWTDGRRYYERKRTEGKTPRRRSAASSTGSPTRSTVSSCATGRAQSKRLPLKSEGRRFDPGPDHTSPLICGNATCRNPVRRPLHVHSAYVIA